MKLQDKEEHVIKATVLNSIHKIRLVESRTRKGGLFSFNSSVCNYTYILLLQIDNRLHALSYINESKRDEDYKVLKICLEREELSNISERERNG
jgi:hypothetical protein